MTSQAWTVRGGPGGLQARLDDLSELSGLHQATGTSLGEVLGGLLAVAGDPLLAAGALLDPGGALRVEEALLHAAGPGGLGGAEAEAGALAGELRAAVVAYRLADDAVLAGRLALGQTVGSAVGLAGPALLPLALLSPAATQRLLTAHPDVVELTLAGVGALVSAPGELFAPVPLLSSQQAVLLAGRLVPDTGTLELRELSTPPAPGDLAAPRTPGDLLRGVARRTLPGEVAVTRLACADGVDRWVVELPGTDSWSPRPGADVRDLAGDLRLASGRGSTYSSGVLAVLAAAGAPPGAPVLLVGHSQGGMAAYAAASSPDLRARYRVAGVLTAGSPLAAMPVPGGVPVLALEDAADVVPRLDGLPEPDLPTVTTAVFHRQTGTIAGNHDLTAYAAAADALPAAPSVLAWRRSTRDFLAESQVTSSRRFVLTRRRARPRTPP